jgi:hypothetical protein
MRIWLSLLLTALLLGGGVPGTTIPAHGEAGREVAGEEPASFPAYSVARLRIFEGTVWVRPPDSEEWIEYYQNGPLSDGTSVSVPDDSEAEIQFHGGQFMLLTGGTELDIRLLTAEKSSFQLFSGEIRFDLPREDFAPVSVLVPGGGRVDFPDPGRFWLSEADGGTRLVVRRGEGVVTVGRGMFHVQAGEEAAIGSREVNIRPFPDGADEFTPSPPLTAYEQKAGVPPAAAYELRDYGTWVFVSDYGYVWRPRVAAGWAPYVYGRWAWVSPIGWTWIAYEPWGWYPYHFGYWFHEPYYGWVWTPHRTFVSVGFVFGRTVHFHRHARFFPATVRFVREDSRVRWVPLRPGERFQRPTFTRGEERHLAWDRPLTRGTVFVRGEGERRMTWHDWVALERGRRANLPRGIETPVRREDGVRARPQVERPGRTDRGERPVIREERERPPARPAPDVRPQVRPDRGGRIEGEAPLERRSLERPDAPRPGVEQRTIERGTGDRGGSYRPDYGIRERRTAPAPRPGVVAPRDAAQRTVAPQTGRVEPRTDGAAERRAAPGLAPVERRGSGTAPARPQYERGAVGRDAGSAPAVQPRVRRFVPGDGGPARGGGAVSPSRGSSRGSGAVGRGWR